MKAIKANQTTARAGRVRVDYMPGRAAVEALQAAQLLYPNSNTQEAVFSDDQTRSLDGKLIRNHQPGSSRRP